MLPRLSVRMRQKMENYAEIFGNILRKKVTIMRIEKTPDYAEICEINKVVPLAFCDI